MKPYIITKCGKVVLLQHIVAVSLVKDDFICIFTIKLSCTDTKTYDLNSFYDEKEARQALQDFVVQHYGNDQI